MSSKPVIALIGGVASGKSAVAEVVNADAEGHEVLRDPEVVSEIESAFGADVIVDQQVDRKKLGAKVFADPALLARLNAITHPRIRLRTQAKIEAGLNDPTIKAVVLDISLPGMGGLELVAPLRDAAPEAQILKPPAKTAQPKNEAGKRAKSPAVRQTSLICLRKKTSPTLSSTTTAHRKTLNARWTQSGINT